MRRSACVPFPTPGAPTSIIRAALLNCLVAVTAIMYRRSIFCLGQGAEGEDKEGSKDIELHEAAKEARSSNMCSIIAS